MIYTSYFSKVKALYEQNPNLVFVSIAGKTPNWFDYSIIKILKYPKLMPKYDWWKVWHEKFKDNLESNESISLYNKYYKEILNNLNPHVVQTELLTMSDRKNVVLLCYETPEKFCHRKLVLNWFNNAKIECKEI